MLRAIYLMSVYYMFLYYWTGLGSSLCSSLIDGPPVFITACVVLTPSTQEELRSKNQEEPVTVDSLFDSATVRPNVAMAASAQQVRRVVLNVKSSELALRRAPRTLMNTSKAERRRAPFGTFFGSACKSCFYDCSMCLWVHLPAFSLGSRSPLAVRSTYCLPTK